MQPLASRPPHWENSTDLPEGLTCRHGQHEDAFNSPRLAPAGKESGLYAR